MSNENDVNAKVNLTAEVFGGANPERIGDTDSAFKVKDGLSTDSTGTQKAITMTLDPQDPDKEATIRLIAEQLGEKLRINFIDAKHMELPAAMNTLIESLKADQSYAWSWHCNIAMAARDEGVDTMVAQRLAARFLQILTVRPGDSGIDTRTFQEYKDLEAQYNAEAKE